MRWFAAIGGLLVLILVATLIAPWFVNFDDYRERFEAEASRILGQPVSARGDISATLIPFPSITLADVTVGDPSDPFMQAESLSLDAELAPFLSGEVLIFDAQLADPVVRLTLGEDWSPSGTLAFPGLPEGVEVAFENATITNGRVMIDDTINNRTWQIEITEAQLAANSLAGPWRMQVSTITDARRLDGDFTLGRVQPDSESVSLSGNVNLLDEQLRFNFEGALALSNAYDIYDGRFFLTNTAHDQSQAYRIDGGLSVARDRITIEEMAGNFGDQANPYVVRGSAEILGGEDPRYAIEVTGNQFGGALSAAPDEETTTSSRGRLVQIVDAVRTLPLPTGMPGQVKLDLPAIVIGETTIRNLILEASPNTSPRSWAINRLNAQLPGRTTFEATGALRLPQAGEPLASGAFDGDVLLASQQPSGLARWISGQAVESARSLPVVGVEASVRAGIENQMFDIKEMRVGPALLTGSLERRSPAVGRPVLIADLSGEDVDVENLLAVADVFGADGDSNWLATHQLEADIALTRPKLWDLVPASVELALRPGNEAVEIDKFLMTDLEGISLAGTGQVTQTNNDRALDFDVELTSANSADAFASLASRLPDGILAERINDLTLLRSDLFDETGLAGVGRAELGVDGLTSLQTSVDGSVGDVGVDGRLSWQANGSLEAQAKMAAEESAAALLAWFSGGIDTQQTIDGAGLLDVAISGNVNGNLDVTSALSTGDDRIAVKATVSRVATLDGFQREARGTFEMDLKSLAPYGDIVPLSPTSGAYESALTAAGKFETTPDKVALTNTTGAFGGIDYNLSRLSSSGGQIDAELELDALSVSPQSVDALTDGSLAALINDQTINAKLRVGEIMVGDRALASDSILSITGVADADNVLATMAAESASIVDGGEAQFQIQSETGPKSVSVSISGSGSELALGSLLQWPDSALVGNISLSASGSGSDWTDMLGKLRGSGTIGAKGAQLSGLNIKALPVLISDADALGFEITDAQIEDIAQARIIDVEQSADIAQLDTPFLIDEGVARFSNLRLDLDGADVTLDGTVEPFTLNSNLTGTLAFNVPDDLAGLLPAIVDVAATGQLGSSLQWSIADNSILLTSIRQRAIENEQRRIEALQDRILDRQRLRRLLRVEEERLTALQLAEQERLRAEALQRIKEEEEAAARAAEEEEARRQREAEAAAERAREEREAQQRAAPVIERRELPDLPEVELDFDALLNPDATIAPLGQ